MKLNFRLVGLVVSLFLLVAFVCGTTEAARPKIKGIDRGRSLYMSNCEACHLLSGENVINPTKPMVRSAKLASEDVFRDFIGEKHGVMPPFPELAKDDQAVHDLYRFVRKLKNQSWEYPAHQPEEPDEDQPQ